MSILSRFAFLALATLVLATSAAHAGDPDFAHQGVAADAKRYEAYLKANWKTEGKSTIILKAEAEKAFAADPRAASRALAAVVGADDKDAAAWTRLAEALLAIKPDENKGSERYDLPVNASGAAYRGYELAKDETAEGARASRARPDTGAALVLAPGDRRLQIFA